LRPLLPHAAAHRRPGRDPESRNNLNPAISIIPRFFRPASSEKLKKHIDNVQIICYFMKAPVAE
jgi:hypothetical protein